MTFTEILTKTRLLWPKAIRIDNTKFGLKDHPVFPDLLSAWESAEIKAEELTEWECLMVWAIYGGLVKASKRALEMGRVEVRVEEIDTEYVERKFSENLFTETLPRYPDSMRDEYVNDIAP